MTRSSTGGSFGAVCLRKDFGLDLCEALSCQSLRHNDIMIDRSFDDIIRYRKLRQYLLDEKIITFNPTPVSDSEPFVMGEQFYGESFDAAVDTLTSGA
jgi:hypothetical protein